MIPGEHSILNALATVALAREVGVDFDVIRDALACFRGVHRRFELLGVVDDIHVVDDYGHHPTEIKATLNAAKKKPSLIVLSAFSNHIDTLVLNSSTANLEPLSSRPTCWS